MGSSDNYLEELEAIKKSISDTEIKISKIKGRSDSIQEEVSALTEELESQGHTFASIQDIEDFKNEKEVRIQRLLRNYRDELSMS